jgi:UDP-N-acetylmuramate: L-alanyl-gamma-D-glutamyl-meso-diaminopimelate ligase
MNPTQTPIELKAGDVVYFMGIGGTGMASVAGLAQEAGYKVIGSDANIYPPMSTMLENLGIAVRTPYSPENILTSGAQLVVVANALSRNHVELEAMLGSGIPYTSFPAFLGDYFLGHRKSIVVAGTHGKTTTTSLLAHVLVQLGWDPGYLIGGIPRTLPRSFALGKGPLFAIEGDEYDTAFFDKDSKFLHYRPRYVILNNIEFDHADIFPSLEAIEAQFTKLLARVDDPARILANVDDPGVVKLLGQLQLTHKVTRVATRGETADASVRLLSLAPPTEGRDAAWTLRIQVAGQAPLTLRTQLAGPHNAANICQILACLWQISQQKDAPQWEPRALEDAIASFTGVKRRLDRLSSAADVEVFEDFAHHPTAVKAVIESMRTLYPSRRLIVAFEPKNATSRRNVFMHEFAASLGLADRVLIGPCPVDLRIPGDQRMNTEVMAHLIGERAQAFADNEELLESLVREARANDAIVFMSSGSFSGIQYRIGDRLANRLPNQSC